MEILDEMVLRAARVAVGDHRARLQRWSSRGVGGGMTGEVGLAGGVRRISGTVVSAGQEIPWSMILKLLRASPLQLDRDTVVPATDPTGWAYWRREAEAHRSGMLDELADIEGLVVPRCFGVDEVDDAIALWLEDVPDEGPSHWSLERYGVAARHIGRLNGRYLGGRPVPSHPWLSTGRVREWTDFGAAGIRAMRSGRSDAFLSSWLSDDSVTRIERLWGAREFLIDAMGSVPVTLCHHDAGRRNLAERRVGGDLCTGVYDWQVVGTGHLGEDPAVMFAVSLQSLDVPSADMHALEKVIVDGYIGGLMDAGWRGDPGPIRRAFAITSSLVIGVGGAGMWFSLARLHGPAIVERMIGRPLDSVAAQWSELQPYLLDLGEEALASVERPR